MDPRFAKVAHDPRFKRPKKKDTLIQIDDRFSHMLESSEFGSLSTQGPKIDKYGRRKKTTVSKDLKKYYRLEEPAQELEELEAVKSVEKLDNSSTSDSEKSSDHSDLNSDDSDDDEENALDLARGKGLEDSSDDESIDDEVIDKVGPYAEQEEDIPTLEEETRRLACVGMDWDHVKAKDLYKIFDGFKPKNGMIVSIKVFPSEFGKTRLAEEASQGPPKTIFQEPEDVGKLLQADDGEEFNAAELRKYQMERLKYYYAIIETDCVATAKALYTECDGTEFEASGNFLDLRFVPDSMEFEDEPTDVATLAPVSYQPIDYVTDALQHSKVKLTWDNEDPERVKVTKRKFTKEDLKDMDFKAYLASSSESEDSENDELRLKYKALLADEDEAPEEDMEITFTSGLSEKASALMEQKKQRELEQDETVFERNLRLKKEKKRAAKSKSNEEDDLLYDENMIDKDDPFFQHDEEVQVKPSKSKSKKSKKTKQELEAEAQSKASLELLLIDENDKTERHFDVKSVLKQEKDSRKKSKKSKKVELGETQDDFNINLEDNRFSSVLQSHHYAIDPTHPSFKKTKAMAQILNQRRQGTHENEEPVVESKDSQLQQLVAAVKRKSANAQSKDGKRVKSAFVEKSL